MEMREIGSTEEAKKASPAQSSEISEAALALLKFEAHRITQQSLVAAERHYAAETPWYHMNYVLGVPSTLFAALAAASAGEYKQVAVVAGVLAAALTALLTFLDPHKRASAHHSVGRNFEALYNAAGFFERFELCAGGSDAVSLHTKLQKLDAQFHELLNSSPAVSPRAQAEAKQKVLNRTGEVLSFDR